MRLPVPVPPPLPAKPWPAPACYRSLMPSDKDSIPVVTTESIEQFVMYRQASGKVVHDDVAIMRKGQLMSKDQVVSLSFYGERTQPKVFFSG